MTANFLDIHAAADYIGPGAVEVPLYQTEITDIVRRRNIFGQRIKQVPATGHPSRYFEQTAIPNPLTAGFVDPRNIVAPVVTPTRVERSVPLKAIVAQLNYNLFDMELGAQQKQFAYLQAKDLVDTIEGVMLAHDVASVERQRHLAERAGDHAVLRRGGADRGGRQHDDDRHCGKHHGWTEVDHRTDVREHQLCGAADGDLRESGSAGSDRSRDEIGVQRGAEHARRSPQGSR